MLASMVEVEADAGPRAARRDVARLCALRRAVTPTDNLIRFVVDPDGIVVPDVKGKLPGRGVWVTADRKSVSEAVRRRVFARGFKRDVTVPGDLDTRVQAALERHALDSLAMAAKAGEAVAGFAKVEAALAAGRAVALLHAREAGTDGVRKLDALVPQSDEEAKNVPIIRAFTSAQLDLAFGRSNVVHAALLAGSASTGFIGRCRRFERFIGPAHAAASEA